MIEITDWEGRPIPDDETPDTIIRVWKVTPHPESRHYDSLVVRSWQEMLIYISAQLPCFLESFEGDEIRAGVSLKFKVIDIRKSDYEEILANYD